MTTPLKPVQRFFRLLDVDKKDITYIYVYAVFAGIINLSLPLGIQAIIGLIAGGDMSASLIFLIVVVTVATALAGILKIMQLTVSETIQRRIFTRSAFDFAYRVPRIQLPSLSGIYPPELVNRFFDTVNLQKGLPKLLMDFSTAMLNIVFSLILISFYHPFFVFFGIALLFILFLIIRFTGPGGLKTSLKESTYKYHVAYWLEEVARAMNTFKLAGRTTLPMRRTDDLVCNYLEQRKSHFRILLFQYGNIVAFKTLITAGLLALGGFLVINNQINIGQFVAAEIIVILVMNSVEKLILTMETIYDVLTALEKLGHVTDLPIEEPSGLSFDQIDSKEGLSLQTHQLSYIFPDSKRPAIEDLSLTIQSGERLCIAGYNGSGKSTLLKILAGLYTDFTGTVSYNGFSAGSLDMESLRGAIGDICQEEDIFRGTILENVSLGEKDVDVRRVLQALKEVGLDPFIDRQSEGIHMQLLPGGMNVSRSVRTRLMVARAIVGEPRMLAVEGMFRGMETSDRLRFARLLSNREKPWSLIVVSDDPIMASHCDRIIIMRQGRIIDEGSFDDLIHTEYFKAVFRTSESEMLTTGIPNLGAK